MVDPTTATTSTDVDAAASRQHTASPTGNVAPLNPKNLEPLPLDGEDLEVDDGRVGLWRQCAIVRVLGAFVPPNWSNLSIRGSTSLRSSIINGLIKNGRKYQVLRDNNVNIPSDERQFDSMEAGHMAYTVLESQQDNPYFRSELSDRAQHIIDLGTGKGDWAIAVADRFPNITVHGVDLYPPPAKWVPPNCIFEVDDILKSWTWSNKFDLVHLRLMNGSFRTAEWDKLYKRVYDNLEPGGWIEQVESDTPLLCIDETQPKDSLTARFATDITPVAAQTGNDMYVPDRMRSRIEAAGFINVQERAFRFPIGDWPKHPIYKEAGALNKKMYKDGFEGFVMYMLTRFGLPQPWSPEEVILYVSKFRQELDQNWHLYQNSKRVWGQKSFDKPKSAQEPAVENVE